ncbi:YTH domain protein [Sarcoptes scabiei]|nr:YTH domain protein [Sarcoptes scabiei]
MAEENGTNSIESNHNENDVELIDLDQDNDEDKMDSVLNSEKQNDSEHEEDQEKMEKDFVEDSSNQEILSENGDSDFIEETENVNGSVAEIDSKVQENIESIQEPIVADEEIMISDDEQEKNDNSDSNLMNDAQSEPENMSLNLSKSNTNESSVNRPKKSSIFQSKSNDYISKKEILIDDDDDDDDEDKVQDLSTKNQVPVEDPIPKLPEEYIGFPSFFKNVIVLGQSIAISKKTRSDIDIDKEYSILDCPSQVVPLIIKKANKFPSKMKPEKEESPPLKPANNPTPTQNTKNMLTISDFYSSTVGKFLIGIGLSRVKQWYHKDAISKVRKQIRKEGEAEDLMEELKKQQEYLNSCRTANSSYIFSTEKCEQCDFRSEFKSVIRYHKVFPHTTSKKEYKCNYCQYLTKDSKAIIEHVNLSHQKRCQIELPQQLYDCPICPYESGVKSKAATHIAKCVKFFVSEKLLLNKDDFFPTITPKPITQEDIKIYEATLQALRFAALNPQTKVPQIAGLPPGLQQQMYMVQQQQLSRNPGPSLPGIGPGNVQPGHNVNVPANRPNKSNKFRSHNNNMFQFNQMKNVNAPQLYQMLSNSPSTAQIPNAPASFSGMSPAALSLLNKQHHPAMPGKLNMHANRNPPSINNMPTNHKMNMMANRPAVNHSSIAPNQKGSFVMCEICDGYIKDLEQLRTHMHWIHKVRIHPKMLASRPPLNCQKCQWRFFTDQGLERHLLGAHGLVTSNMQDMVNQNQDGGRCTICGRVFTSKLVTHMSQAHKINLKPAHLSYKCTVCSATFNLYRLFENHVYMVHSGSVKRNNTGDEANQPPRKKTALDLAATNGN